MKAFIYDMDGVIVDSEPVHMEAEQKIMKKLGYDVPRSVWESYQGRSDIELWSAVIERYHLKGQVAASLAKAKAYLFNRTMREQGAKAIPGALDLIRRTDERRAQGLRTAIASSSERSFIAFVVDSLGIRDSFDLFTSGAELPFSKPDPAIYLKTAADLRVAPADCVVIEDAANGVRAAKAAGMYCIGFISPHSGRQDLSLADRIVADMSEIDLAAL